MSGANRQSCGGSSTIQLSNDSPYDRRTVDTMSSTLPRTQSAYSSEKIYYHDNRHANALSWSRPQALSYESDYPSQRLLQSTPMLGHSSLSEQHVGVIVCRYCGNACTRLDVSPTNYRGNIGRSYYKCIAGPRACGRFKCWDDDVEVDNGNQPCFCGQASRRGRTAFEKGGRMHLGCAKGDCEFYLELGRESGPSQHPGRAQTQFTRQPSRTADASHDARPRKKSIWQRMACC